MKKKNREVIDSLVAIDAIAGGLGENWFAEQAGNGRTVSAKAMVRLRQEYGPTVAGWLLEFAAAHDKAVEKFGEGRWLTTQRSIQQATDGQTAAYKSSRFPNKEPVIDICCGVGGDAMALARRGPLVALDRDPSVARMAAANLSEGRSSAGDRPSAASDAIVAAFDAESCLPLPAGRLVHIDPDRRVGERRTIDPEHFQPSLETVEKAIENARGAAVKLAPATMAPESWENRCLREWISFRGSVRQQVAWFGELCGESLPGISRATRLQADGAVATFSVKSEKRTAEAPSASSIGPFIIDFDPAVRAAGLSLALAETLGLQSLGGPAGFFTVDCLDRTHPLAESYEILWSGAARWKTMEAAIRASAVRIVAIKVRGASIRPEEIQKKIRQAAIGEPKEDATLLIGRLGKRIYAVIGKPLLSDGDGRI